MSLLKKHLPEERVKEMANVKMGRKGYIVINAPTGIGKTTYVLNVLYWIAKDLDSKILILENRTPLLNEIKNRVADEHKDDVIEVMTYQKMESYSNRNNEYLPLSEYLFVVCDESHYFLTDSTFNKNTQESLDTINQANNSVKILMSATNDELIEFFDYEKIDYVKVEVPTNYDYIKGIAWFNSKETLFNIAEECKENNQKCMFFIQDLELMEELYLAYEEDSIFLCSNSNKKFYNRYTDEEKLNKMLAEHKFDCLFLFATSVFENGNNIIDEDLHKMVIQTNDLGSLKQMIGRKRLTSDDDYLDIAIMNLSRNKLNGLIRKCKETLTVVDYLIEHGEEDFINKYGKCYNNCIYYIWNHKNKCIKTKINKPMYFKTQKNLENYTKWLDDEWHVGFKRSVLEMLGKKWKDSYNVDIENLYEVRRLTTILDDYKGELITKKYKDDFINLLNIKNDKYRLIKNMNDINEYLEKLDVEYHIEVCVLPKTRKSAWVVKVNKAE